ncbi:flagellar basal-body rod protein FlgF [Paenibacillus sp. J31TS4]|uniref:flagellar hook-basal body protein n=1 Tax=Paenibacillus sp. J31TS4 TaxID=2807195 RepID=UPI001AFE1F46|nr:flagellar hook-basal body protein [Paenibacillus sp. J31TS4]GIP40962.1 flagellar basal-body rod protein FlgF [Paenibacillus sp. J31TS4]
MLRGLYTSASGMLTQQRKHDTITNNIANLNTAGFKQGNAVSRAFPEMLISLVNGEPGQKTSQSIGRLNAGVLVEEDVPTFGQGALQETGNSLDLALVSDIRVPGRQFDASGKEVLADGTWVFQPQAFFTVADGQNNRYYTRDGKFTASELGQLVTAEGFRVLGRDGQPLTLRAQDGTPLSNVRITETGELVGLDNQPVVDAAGEPVGVLLSVVGNPNRLIREGNNVFRLNEEDAREVRQADPAEGVQVRQGFVERSNVDAAQSTVDMMAALRAYEANQKMVQFYDKSLEKAVNEVGRV